MDTDFLCTQAIADDLDETNEEETDEEEPEKEFGTLKVLPNGKLRIPSIEFPIYQGENTVGRHTECAMSIPWSLAMSKKHAIIEVDQGTCFICDCGSSNKTRLNKVKLIPNVKYGMRDGDEIILGDVKCIFKQINNGAGPIVASAINKACSTPSTSKMQNPPDEKLLAADTPCRIFEANNGMQTTLNESTSTIPDSQPEPKTTVSAGCPQSPKTFPDGSVPPLDLDETLSDEELPAPSTRMNNSNISHVEESDSAAETDYHMDSDTDIEDNAAMERVAKDDEADSDATDIYDADTMELKSEQNSEIVSRAVQSADDFQADNTIEESDEEEMSLLRNVDSELMQICNPETVKSENTQNDDADKPGCSKSEPMLQDVPDTYDDFCTQAYSPAVILEEDEDPTKETYNESAMENLKSESPGGMKEESSVAQTSDRFDDLCTQAFPPILQDDEDDLPTDVQDEETNVNAEALQAEFNDTLDMLETQAFALDKESPVPPMQQKDAGSDEDSDLEDSMLFNIATQAFTAPRKRNLAPKKDAGEQSKECAAGQQLEDPAGQLGVEDHEVLKISSGASETMMIYQDKAGQSAISADPLTSTDNSRQLVPSKPIISSQESVNDTEPFDTEPYQRKDAPPMKDCGDVPQLLPTSETTVPLTLYSSVLSATPPVVSQSKDDLECMGDSAAGGIEAGETLDDEETQTYEVDGMEIDSDLNSTFLEGNADDMPEEETQAYAIELCEPPLAILENAPKTSQPTPLVVDRGIDTIRIDDASVVNNNAQVLDEDKTQTCDTETIDCADDESTVPVAENVGMDTIDATIPLSLEDMATIPVEEEISDEAHTHHSAEPNNGMQGFDVAAAARTGIENVPGTGAGENTNGATVVTSPCDNHVNGGNIAPAVLIDPVGGQRCLLSAQSLNDPEKTQPLVDSESTEMYDEMDADEVLYHVEGSNNSLTEAPVSSHDVFELSGNTELNCADKKESANAPPKFRSDGEGPAANKGSSAEMKEEIDPLGGSSGLNKEISVTDIGQENETYKHVNDTEVEVSGVLTDKKEGKMVSVDNKDGKKAITSADNKIVDVGATQAYFCINIEPVESSNFGTKQSPLLPGQHETVGLDEGENILDGTEATQAYIGVSDALNLDQSEHTMQTDDMQSTQAYTGPNAFTSVRKQTSENGPSSSNRNQRQTIADNDVEPTQSYLNTSSKRRTKRQGSAATSDAPLETGNMPHPKEVETVPSAEFSNLPSTSGVSQPLPKPKKLLGTKMATKKSAPAKTRNMKQNVGKENDTTLRESTRRSRRTSKKLDYAAVASGRTNEAAEKMDEPEPSQLGRKTRTGRKPEKQEPKEEIEAQHLESTATSNGVNDHPPTQRNTRTRDIKLQKSQQVQNETKQSPRQKVKAERSLSTDEAASSSSDTSARKSGRKRKNTSTSVADLKTPAKKVKSEEDTEDDSQSDISRALRPRREKPKVMFTGVLDDVAETIVRSLGGDFASDMHDCTHLVTDKMRRTIKFLCAVVRGIHILTPDWLHRSGQLGRFLPEEDFLLTEDTCSPDGESLQNKYSFSLHSTVQAARSNIRLLFAGLRVFVTRNVVPTTDQMNQILKCGGAELLSQIPTFNGAERADNIVIVATQRDKRACASAIQARCHVVSNEFVLTGVLRHAVDFETHALFGTGAQTWDSNVAHAPVSAPGDDAPTVVKIQKRETVKKESETTHGVVSNRRETALKRRSQDGAAAATGQKTVAARRSKRNNQVSKAVTTTNVRPRRSRKKTT